MLSRVVRKALVPLLVVGSLLAVGYLSPRFVPYDMDEFAAYHALGCATHPLTRAYDGSFREPCREDDLRLPLLRQHPLPLRSYLYLGSLPVVPFYPFWRAFRDPVAVRVQGASLLLAAVWLVAALARVRFERALLAAFLFPVFPGSFLVDTGPVGLSLVFLAGALLLARRAVAAPARASFWPAASAGLLVFLGIWIKPVFAWCLPAVVGHWLLETRSTRSRFPQGSSWKAVGALLLAATIPTALLMSATTYDGTPYYRVAQAGRWSLEAGNVERIAGSLSWYLVDGSAVVSRVLSLPPSWIDVLPLLLGLALVLTTDAAQRREVALWLVAAFVTFGLADLSQRALEPHHAVFPLFFVVLAVARSLGSPRAGLRLALSALVIALFWANLARRWPEAETDPRKDFGKDRLLAWVRDSGLDRRSVQLHTSWGTYYIAHLFADRDAIVLFSRKLATDRHLLAEARGVALREGRVVLIVSRRPDRLASDVVEGVLGPPLEERAFGGWWTAEYAR